MWPCDAAQWRAVDGKTYTDYHFCTDAYNDDDDDADADADDADAVDNDTADNNEYYSDDDVIDV